jgi:hypothetical protein
LRNIDWWDKWSPEEAYAVDKATELRKPHYEVIVPPKPWKGADMIETAEEEELKVCYGREGEGMKKVEARIKDAKAF